MMRGLILAFQFLTRLPMPSLVDVEEDELASASVWFPVVGLSIGVLLVAVSLLGLQVNHWVAALLVVLVWTAVTGALHLDGAADLADALGASHRDSESFISTLKDPHIGAFGVLVLVFIILTKLVMVAWLVESPNATPWLLLLIPAWARLGSMYWGQILKPLSAGSGAVFANQNLDQSLWLWGLCLVLLSVFSVSLLFAILAVLSLFLWGAFLKWRVQGMTGDCLGAGIEYCECAMLLLVSFIL